MTTPDPSPATNGTDDHHGMGGRYEVIDGRRVLVQRTQEAPAADAPVADPLAPEPTEGESDGTAIA